MHESSKWSDVKQKRCVYNEYRYLCRRKRELWLAQRLDEVDRVFNVDKANMWHTIDALSGINKSFAPQVDVDRLRAHYCKSFNTDSSAAEVSEDPAEVRPPTSPLDLRKDPYVTKTEIEAVLKAIRRRVSMVSSLTCCVICVQFLFS